jgi:hypothetical protein
VKGWLAMEAIFGFGVGFLFLVVLPLTLGIRIRKAVTLRTSPAEEQTLRFLGLNLIEPAVNIFVVPALMFLLQPDFIRDLMNEFSTPFWPSFGVALGLTLPMAVLLLPLIGWNSVDRRCRWINRQLVGLGLLRWGVTALTLIWPPALIGGILIFISSLVWVSIKARQIADPTSSRFKPIGLGPEGVMVGELGDFKLGNQPDVRI